jgi:lipid-A-disaccharide synthase
MKTIFLLAGEHSGDRHGAGLMEELRTLSPGIQLHGLGGPEMAALSPDITDWVEEAGVVGIVDVLKKYPWFMEKFAATLQRILTLQPDAAVLIDYTGFNLRMAKALRKARFPGKIIYYISPQVWAWQRGRIPKMAQRLDLMICIFPFEQALYEGVGLRTIFAGHPLVEYHQSRCLHLTRNPDEIGLFPGSRRREVLKHFPVLLETARLMKAAHPGLTFAVSAASEKLAGLMQAHLTTAPLPGLTIETGTVHTLMQRVACGAVASGTATLEAAIHGLPYCLIYKVAWGTWLLGKAVIRVPWLGIVNLLAKRELVRELIQTDCSPKRIAAELTRLHQDAAARAQLQQDLAKVVAGLTGTGAYQRAAATILEATIPSLQ